MTRNVQASRRSADEEGVTTVEYGLLAAFIGLVFIAAGPLLEQGLSLFRDLILKGMVGS